MKLSPIKNIPTFNELEERLEKISMNDDRDAIKHPLPSLQPLDRGNEDGREEEEEEMTSKKGLRKRKKKRKKKTIADDTNLGTNCSTKDDLVLKDLSSGDESKKESLQKKKKKKKSMPKYDLDSAPKAEDIDLVLDYTDSTVVSDWLQRANDMLQSLTDWCCAKDNFVQFAHFWLSTFTDSDSQQVGSASLT